MSITRTLGGNRLGSGNKMDVQMRTYERSTHNLSYIWRSTMAAGTLVPFMTEVGLPGDTFDIDLDCDIMTHPTVGPLFGSYKVQLDVFSIPVRLYQAQLHNNKLGIGLNMANIKLPQVELRSTTITGVKETDNSQINPSCIFSYLNIRGIGIEKKDTTVNFRREFNAIPYLAYWDIYKNYYANKQEEIGAVIHNAANPEPPYTQYAAYYGAAVGEPDTNTIGINGATAPQISRTLGGTAKIRYGDPETGTPTLENTLFEIAMVSGYVWVKASELAASVSYDEWSGEPYAVFDVDDVPNPEYTGWLGIRSTNVNTENPFTEEPQVYTFDLENIDQMRQDILAAVNTPTAFIINENSIEPYNLPLIWTGEGNQTLYSKQTPLEGLALKTYQSDLFNNWISTEWIDGDNGINAITAVDVSAGSFTIDQLNLSKKVYNMLNRIGASGGTYKDWIDTVYTAETQWNAESPIYMGGLIKELVFQEVVSNAEAGTEEKAQPLGTLAGKGRLSSKHKGGKINIKVTEPSYIMGIISLTPRVDYSQGNKWDVNLKTMDDFHKPALDEIGFQDLITDQMAWWDTDIEELNIPKFKSAGKQPAWINYMTNVNQVRGNFADENNEMFMTLNRRYERGEDGYIKDLTTYIDPAKFNFVFAQTARDSQNFWTQISVDTTARRKMSAKVIPNL